MQSGRAGRAGQSKTHLSIKKRADLLPRGRGLRLKIALMLDFNTSRLYYPFGISTCLCTGYNHAKLNKLN
jgi:hypothetical protein